VYVILWVIMPYRPSASFAELPDRRAAPGP